MKNWPWSTINKLIWCFVGVQLGWSAARDWWPHNHWAPFLLSAVSAYCAMGIHDRLSAEYKQRKAGRR